MSKSIDLIYGKHENEVEYGILLSMMRGEMREGGSIMEEVDNLHREIVNKYKLTTDER